MSTFQKFLVLAAFTVSTYITLNFILDISWDWVLIGQITVAIFAIICSITVGGLIAHGLLSLMQRTSFRNGIFGS